VGGEVVADDVDLQPGFDLAVDVVEEVAEVDGPVPFGQLAGGGVERGEQVDGAVPDVVVAAPPGLAGRAVQALPRRSPSWHRPR